MRIALFAATFALTIAAIWPAMADLPQNWNHPKPTHPVEERTAGRPVEGSTITAPDWMMDRPQYFEFTPMISNHDTQNQHPGQWAGQEWDTSRWPRGWTAQTAIHKFQRGGILTGMNAGSREVTVGPVFFKLSQLDQTRVMKLLADNTGLFAKSQLPVILRDHATGNVVGAYSPTGLQLN